MSIPDNSVEKTVVASRLVTPVPELNYSNAATIQPSSPIEVKPEVVMLAALSDADSNELDMGCMGSFSSKKHDVLYVSSGTLIFRPDGKRVIGPVTERDFEALNSDDATVYAGGYRLRLVSRGMQKGAFDGHSVNAVLTISKDAKATSYAGIWGVAC